MSFFESTETAQKRGDTYMFPQCGACGLHKTCKSPKIPVTGDGRRGILVVGEAPGEEDDERNCHLSGKPGHFLREALDAYGIDLYRDCWSTDALICHPPKDKPPTPVEVDYCRPNLNKLIRDLKPKIIIPLGAAAIASVIGPIWKDGEGLGPVRRWAGWNIPSHRHNAWICPNFHPNFVLHAMDKLANKEGPAIKLWFDRYLSAVGLQNRPWPDEVPNYAKRVRVILDSDEAATWLDDVTKRAGEFPIAFDFETNGLKPDRDCMRIFSCAVAYRDECIAYPWVGSAVAATSRLLRSTVKKVGANTKFEDRWTRAKLGHPVNRWIWDTMLSAHHLDNRKQVCSVKFQALVRLGQEDWSWKVDDLLSDSDDREVNRIHEIDMQTLCMYNGIDAVVELELFHNQIAEMMRG